MMRKEPLTERRRATDLEIDGPFGLRARFFNKELTSVLLLAICVFGIGYLIYEHDRNSMDNIKHIVENQRFIYGQMDAIIYVMSLPENEREKLKLAMPDSLRKKIKEGQ